MNITKQNYNKKYKIYKKHKKKIQFKPGVKILYFIKDISVKNHKWKQKWSGPWKILQRLDDRTLIITDPVDNIIERVSIDRCKIFKNDKHFTLDRYYKMMKDRIKMNKDS